MLSCVHVGKVPIITAKFLSINLSTYYFLLGHLNIVQLLLGMDNIDLNVCSQRGETALIRACMSDHFEIAKLLIYHGASVRIGGNGLGITQLYTS